MAANVCWRTLIEYLGDQLENAFSRFGKILEAQVNFRLVFLICLLIKFCARGNHQDVLIYLSYMNPSSSD